jgi:hypothetical protein
VVCRLDLGVEAADVDDRGVEPVVPQGVGFGVIFDAVFKGSFPPMGRMGTFGGVLTKGLSV